MGRRTIQERRTKRTKATILQPSQRISLHVEDPDEPSTQKEKGEGQHSRDGKERTIQQTVQTSFWSADGKPISAEEFLNNLVLVQDYAKLSQGPEDRMCGNCGVMPLTRKTLLERLRLRAGFGSETDDLTDFRKSW
jgi:type I restriction enzyme R subunit